MIRDKIITVIANTLSIDSQYIEDDTNLALLCILSIYLGKLDDKDKESLKISKEGLKRSLRSSPLKQIHENSDSYYELNFLIENSGNQSFRYYDEVGSDSFFNYQFEILTLALTIEKELSVQINDEQWDDMENVGEIISIIHKQDKN